MPPRRTTPAGYEHGRRLRKEMTPAELKLWTFLRRGQLRAVRFRRQHPIAPYVTDFCSLKTKVVIELDGSQHIGRHEQDPERTAFLASLGYRVLRFWNRDVIDNVDGVVAAILDLLPVK